MRKSALLLAVAILPTLAAAQTAQRMPPSSNTAGYPTTVSDGSKVLVQTVTPVDATGNPLGTAGNPLNVANTGNGTGNTTDVTGTGSLALATSNATYVIPLSAGRNAVGLTVNGLTGSGATITVERSNDGGTTWTNANTTDSSATASLSPTLTTNGQARVGVAGATNLRLRVSTAGTGTATIAYDATTAAGPVFLTSLLPSTANPGTFSIGNTTTADSFVAPAPIAATVNTAYTVTLGRGQGTVAFAITGLTASGATLTSQYSDDNGANYYALRNIGTATVPGSTTFTTDGPISFTAGGHTNLRLIVTTAGTGNITIGSNASVPARGVNLEGAGTASTNPLYATVTGGGTAGTPAAGVVTVQGIAGGVAQPVSGTVTANQGTSPWIVNGSGYTQPVSNGGTFAVQSAITNGTNTFNKTAPTLGANAHGYLGYIDLGSATQVAGTAINVTILSPTAGTIAVSYSDDAATPIVYDQARAVTANTALTYSVPIFARYFLIDFLNGGTAQGSATRIAVSVSTGK